MIHLDDEQLSEAARSSAAPVSKSPASPADFASASPSVSVSVSVSVHLKRCDWCARQVAGLAAIAAAVRVVDEEATGVVAVPSFNALLGGRLAVSRPSEHGAYAAAVSVPGVVPVAGLTASWRLAVAVIGRQWRLLPGFGLGAVTVMGLFVAVVLALSAPSPAVGTRAFAAAVSLVVLVGAGAVCSPRWEPRRELLLVMPVSPVAVFGCRLVLVLGAEMLAALGASVVASALRLQADLSALILSWLGPALVAAAALVVVSVWRSAVLGVLVGALVWFIGAAAGLAHAQGAVAGLGVILAPLSGTTPWVLTLAAVLLVAAMLRVSSADQEVLR